jgi:hypothetical protein
MSVSPVKLFEYAAGSLPVLTFWNDEIPKNSGIFCYRTLDEALYLLKEALTSRSLDMQSSLRSFGMKNLWSYRVQTILKFLENMDS